MKKLEMKSFLDLEPSSKSERHVAWRIGRKNLFFSEKNFKMPKIAPDFLKFGLDLLYQVSC